MRKTVRPASKSVFRSSAFVGALILTALGAWAQTRPAGLEPVDEVIAAERAFAADTRARGPGSSFRAAVAPDAIGFAPNPQTGQLDLIDARARAESRPPSTQGVDVRWWPIFAGAAASGELGFTTGPVIFPTGRFGYIFTVWVRQADGSWRYYFDGGPPVDAAPLTGPDAPVVRLRSVHMRRGSAAHAEAEVRNAEQILNSRARTDSRRAYLAYLTDDTRLMGSGIVPTIGRTDARRELERRAVSIEFEPLGMRAAQSGDLVFTYGRTRSGTAHGAYTRIWQKRPGGWRLIIDQIQVPPAAATPSPSQN